MEHKEDLEILLAAEFAESEVDRLCQFCRDYKEREEQTTLADQRRLEFIRWMVRSKRLTDELT
ncbi:MAG TPA: hypothetical protein VN954_05490 [Ktedonobacteraceae bacterium]|nr:hypothetical protein [Ktedonobacteraceae bacterium]